MRKFLLPGLTLSILLFPLLLTAQTEPTATPEPDPEMEKDDGSPADHSLVARILLNDYALPNGFESDSLAMSNGLELAYVRNINRFLNIAFPVKVGLANVSGFRNKRTMISADAILQIQYYEKDAFLVPYIFGGGGVVSENFEMTNVQFPVGVGLNFRVGDRSYLNLQGEYRIAQAEERNNLQYGIGFWFRLGKRSYEEQLRLDSDGDSIPDVQDQCPDEPGLPGLFGCPDRDSDGIADIQDDCPDLPGKTATSGCPDADDDGVIDSEDKCPAEAGPAANNGCPYDEDEESQTTTEPVTSANTGTDSDADGIMDDKDACPTQPGPALTNGCPDSDADGVADVDDDCPNSAGPKSNQGCPTATQDSDGDGIIDSKDACPDVAGPLVLEGCPDTDGDGIIDSKDECPNLPGAAVTNGCPNVDTDGDGVLDHLDNCPQVAGSRNTGGCPDSDGDGILDSADQCPYQAGPADRQGCPFIDNDGDGIEDKDDECPYQAGPASRNGCPFIDNDGDGVEDKFDECPGEKGTAATAGCPDRDADGVADKLDACPDKPGPFNGCPDTDADGIDDSKDACPNTPGPATNYGCPEIKVEEKRVLEEAAQAVVFEVGKATLKAESYAVLDQVAGIMLRYPDYKVVITGYTDNTGRSSNNQVLSEERAKSCYEYLVSKGIARQRMQYVGEGEANPIADNSTEAGRELNRRVEFEMYIR